MSPDPQTDLKHDFQLLGETKNTHYQLENLKSNSAYYVMVTATNEIGEGYKTEHPSIVITKRKSFDTPKSMYVWGSNTNSEIGLTEELVEQNKKYFHQSKVIKTTYVSRAIKHD